MPLFSSVSSLPLSFLLASSVLSFSVQTGLWSSCPKTFIWTVYRVNMLSWFMRPLVAGARGEQARRERPVAPNGLLGPGQYRSREWLARMQVYCRHSTSFSPSSCDTYPFMLFPPSPWADQKCAIYCEPLSQDPGGRRDHGVNVKMPPHSQASFVGKEEGSGLNLTVYLARKESPLPAITMPRVPVLQYCTCSQS